MENEQQFNLQTFNEYKGLHHYKTKALATANQILSAFNTYDARSREKVRRPNYSDFITIFRREQAWVDDLVRYYIELLMRFGDQKTKTKINQLTFEEAPQDTDSARFLSESGSILAAAISEYQHSGC